jgi:flavoprotein hydroxylase
LPEAWRALAGLASFVPVADGRDEIWDVLIVGYGPVGQVLSLLLARKGWRVSVIDRWPTPYTKPRAVSFDGQAARIIAAAGVGLPIAGVCEPGADYEVANADGETLLRFELKRSGRHGWPDSTSVHLPGLEEALAARAAQWPNLSVTRGIRAVQIAERGSTVDVVAEDTVTCVRQTISARWVIGCDGANSFVREHLRTGWQDAGFSRDWMACDVVPHDPAAFEPCNLQVADPRRPRVVVSAGPGQRRYEFMRMPGEALPRFDGVEGAWRLLRTFGMTRDQGTLVRHAVYRFEARNADRWRVNRILLAGDAAHQMPPFAGQGMCTGIRDAANLAWKLDLVLRKRAADSILDTYEAECRTQAQRAIDVSVGLGRLICLTDPVAAAHRDAAMRASAGSASGHTGQPGDLPVDGFVHKGPNGPVGAAGHVAPQARLGRRGGTGLFDELLGDGFVLLTAVDAATLTDSAGRRLLGRLGARIARVLPANAGAGTARGHGVTDVDNVYLPWLDSIAAGAVLIRPDRYVYGVAGDGNGFGRMLGRLADDLAPGQPNRRPSSRR